MKIHISSRRKIIVRKVPEGFWYSTLAGKALWVNRKRIRLNEFGKKIYNLHFHYTYLEIPVEDTIWVPKFIRKAFHTVNQELGELIPHFVN